MAGGQERMIPAEAAPQMCIAYWTRRDSSSSGRSAISCARSWSASFRAEMVRGGRWPAQKLVSDRNFGDGRTNDRSPPKQRSNGTCATLQQTDGPLAYRECGLAVSVRWVRRSVDMDRQAPHWAMPQPNLVPVSLMSSRSHSLGWRTGTFAH